MFSKGDIRRWTIDGLSELQILIKLYVPTMKPTYAATAIITFIVSWNNYMWPLITLQTASKRTVLLIKDTMSSSYTPDYGMIMVGIVIGKLPKTLVLFVMQNQFVEGMLGSVKR